jgi:hypothetical protein
VHFASKFSLGLTLTLTLTLHHATAVTTTALTLQVPEACTFRIQVTHSNTDLFADDLFAGANDGDDSWTAVGPAVAIQQQQQRRGSSSKGKVSIYIYCYTLSLLLLLVPHVYRYYCCQWHCCYVADVVTDRHRRGKLCYQGVMVSSQILMLCQHHLT